MTPRSGDAPARIASSVPQAAVSDDLSMPQWSPELQALIVPPVGWQPGIIPADFGAHHLIWISPSGRTAFGVIRFSLPLPLPHDPVLWFFLREMRQKEGKAELLSKAWDSDRRRLRAVIDGSRYTLRATFTLRGLSGWITYAGTVRDEPIASEELSTAEAAREGTIPGQASFGR